MHVWDIVQLKNGLIEHLLVTCVSFVLIMFMYGKADLLLQLLHNLEYYPPAAVLACSRSLQWFSLWSMIASMVRAFIAGYSKWSLFGQYFRSVLWKTSSCPEK